MADAIAQFARAKYLNLETFRKTGVGVRTPVWFAQDVLHSAPTITVFYIYSEADAGKVKRIRNNPKVRSWDCPVRGDPIHCAVAWGGTEPDRQLRPT
jgi:PPOX class probable F420-dependent enzyme